MRAGRSVEMASAHRLLCRIQERTGKASAVSMCRICFTSLILQLMQKIDISAPAAEQVGLPAHLLGRLRGGTLHIRGYEYNSTKPSRPGSKHSDAIR